MFYITSVETFCKSNRIDDEKRNAGLKTPDGVRRVDDIPYGAHPRNLLDVYRPKNESGRLPVIVSIHGGGWVYGDKELMQFYCMSLAERGFAVVNFSYRLAPEFKHPAPLEDANSVFCWVLENADAYGFDTDNIFVVGDSVGANLAGLYCRICTDPAYANKLGITPPDFFPRGLGLNSGMFRLDRGEELLLDNLAGEYMPNGGTDEEFAELDLGAHLTEAFPPSFVMTALGDFLAPQAKPFYERLLSLGVEAEYHCYGVAGNELKHVFHIDLRLPEAKISNDEECEFFRKLIRNRRAVS